MQTRTLGNRLEVSAPWFWPRGSELRLQKLHRLGENRGATNVEFTADDLAEIEGAAAEIQVEGERYPEHLMKTTGS